MAKGLFILILLIGISGFIFLGVSFVSAQGCPSYGCFCAAKNIGCTEGRLLCNNACCPGTYGCDLQKFVCCEKCRNDCQCVPSVNCSNMSGCTSAGCCGAAGCGAGQVCCKETVAGPGPSLGICDAYCSDPTNNPEPANIECICPATGNINLTDLLDDVMNYIFWIATILMPILIIIGGFYFMTSGGEYEKVNRAKKIIIYTAIGYAIVLFSRGLVYVLANVLGQ